MQILVSEHNIAVMMSIVTRGTASESAIFSEYGPIVSSPQSSISKKETEYHYSYQNEYLL